jgi:hypothetical protein
LMPSPFDSARLRPTIEPSWSLGRRFT